MSRSRGNAHEQHVCSRSCGLADERGIRCGHHWQYRTSVADRISLLSQAVSLAAQHQRKPLVSSTVYKRFTSTQDNGFSSATLEALVGSESAMSVFKRCIDESQDAILSLGASGQGQMRVANVSCITSTNPAASEFACTTVEFPTSVVFSSCLRFTRVSPSPRETPRSSPGTRKAL